jgi:hypothetical protein
MDIETILLQHAADMAKSLEGGTAALQAELRALERRKIEIDAELEAAKLARQRLLEYRPRLGPDFQCPHCWVESETRSTLVPLDGATDDDVLRCNTCRSEYVIPA